MNEEAAAAAAPRALKGTRRSSGNFTPTTTTTPRHIPFPSAPPTRWPAHVQGTFVWMSSARRHLEPLEEDKRDRRTGSSGPSEEVSDGRHAAFAGRLCFTGCQCLLKSLGAACQEIQQVLCRRGGSHTADRERKRRRTRRMGENVHVMLLAAVISASAWLSMLQRCRFNTVHARNVTQAFGWSVVEGERR